MLPQLCADWVSILLSIFFDDIVLINAVMLGFKYAMIISFWGYSLQIGSLYLAIRFPSCAWPIAIIGSVIAGFTSAIWWTSQGVCFELACQRIVESNRYDKFSQSIDDVRANISAYWTIIYQSCDIVVFVAMSLFPIFAHASMESVVLALTILGIVTSLLGHTFHEFGEVIDSFDIQDTLKSIAAVPRHIIFDARALLLAPFVFGFGITTAMFAYYVNSDLISSSGSLGDSYLGFLEAFSYFVATISAVPYSIVSKKFVNGQHAVIQFGSLNFLLTGVLVFSFSNSKLGSWEYMIILKALYGLGRGVFEGSCRAVYANMFAGDDLAVAFSTQTLMAGFSGGLCYFLYGVISKEAIALITMGNGILALTTYFILISHDSKSKLPWKTLFLSHDVEKTSLMNESKKNGSHLELFR